MGTGGLPTIGHQRTFCSLSLIILSSSLYAEDCTRYNSSICLTNFFVCLMHLCNLRLLRCYRSVSSPASIASATLLRDSHRLTLLNYCSTLRSSSLLFASQNSVHSAPRFFEFSALRLHSTQNSIRKSPRPISIARLKMLPLLHLRPINVVICNGTY